MAKILVADDNSNIQKMVILALKDQGIEVVAVGNGEAAVRKITDLKPDLVLADIFMPVRNGYEVCKFVKDDPALAHIPVILLVGAFDPLDEQEASRVGADGVLKKPFVPPDPLISMVKAALARAGVPLVAPAAATPPPPMPMAKKPELAPGPRVVTTPAYSAELEEEFSAPANVASRPAPFTIDKGAQPLAFGSLLETETPEDDAIFAVSPTTHAAPDRDWGSTSAAEEEEEAEEESATGSWRVSSMPDNADETPAGQTDWREAAFKGIVPEKPRTEGWAPSLEKQSLAITEEEASALARARDAFPAIIGARGPENWGKAIAEILPEKPPAAEESHVSATTELPHVPPPPIPEPAKAIPAAPPQSQSRPDVNSWMAGAVSPWESELQRASQLAATWDNAKFAPAAVVEETSATEAFLDSGLMAAAPKAHEESVAQDQPAEKAAGVTATHETGSESIVSVQPTVEAVSAIEALLSPVTQEILHEEAAHAVAEEAPAVHEALTAGAIATNETAPAAAPNMEELVAKVLARMNPDALQAITREILKPLVEAMLKDELQKK